MPKISDAKRAARRSQILEAAWTCFQRQGLHATTMGEIIRASGLSAGAVYSYFPSKEDLILAAVATSLHGLRLRVEPILKAAPPLQPHQLVGQIAEAISDFTARESYDLRRIALLGWSEAQRNEKLRLLMRDFYIVFRSQLAEIAAVWQKDGRSRSHATRQEIAKAVMAEILGYVVQSAIIGDVEPAELSRGLLGMTLAGVADAP